jgi:hypothetical protein
MRFKIYVLRYRGRRLPWRDVLNGPHHVGEVVSHQVGMGPERYDVLTLQPDDPAQPSPIAPLYQPVLLGFFTLAIRLRGFENVTRGTSAFGAVQEWHCELP